jgi:hypothetical protein
MYYFVFSRTRNGNGNFTNFMKFAGIHKRSAVRDFESLLESYCSINATYPRITYFVGFDSGLPFLKEALATLPEIGESFSSIEPDFVADGVGSSGSSNESPEYSTLQRLMDEFVVVLLNNIESAIFVNTLTTSGYNHERVQNCEDCNCVDGFAKKNIYGKQLCAKCMADYMATREGLAEYFVGLADGNYNANSFIDEDFAAIAYAWYYPPSDSENAKSNKELLIEAYTAKGMSEEAINGLIRAAEEGFELRTGYIKENLEQ